MASVAYSGGVTYADGSSMDIGTGSGKYCTDLKIGGIEYRITAIGAPKTDGFGTKNFGKGTQVLIAEIMYLGASESAIISQANTDFTSIDATPQTITAGGIAFQACLSKPVLAQPKRNGFGAFMATGTITITRLRYS